MTAQELIDIVLSMTNVVGEAGTPTTLQRTTVLQIFNDMLGTWNAEGLLTSFKDTASYNLVANTNSYTIGPSGADFTATRPVDILLAELRDSANQDSDIDIISWEDFEKLEQANDAASRPNALTYKKAYPNATIKVWPKPDRVYALRLTTDSLFGTLALGTTIDNNPGYIEAFEYNLAVRVAIHYIKPVDNAHVILGESSLRILRKNNVQVSDAPVASGVLQNMKPRYDINRGY